MISQVCWLLLLVSTAYCSQSSSSSSSSSSSEEDNYSRYRGAQLLKIHANPGVSELIRDLGLDIWKKTGTYLDVLVPAQSSRLLRNELDSKSISYEVKIPNLERLLKRFNSSPQESTRGLRGGSPISFKDFNRLSAIHGYLDYLAQKYPQIVSVGIMGYSQEKRPLKYIQISSGKPNANIVFIDGGIHAREWAAPAAVTYIIKELVENRKNLPKDLLNVDFIILPVINPDGYEYTHTNDRMWRKNRSGNGRCRGADINRNFDFHFAGLGTSGNPCSETYHGASAHSELESQALSKFLIRLKGRLQAYISFHSYGQYILVPYGYDNDKFAPDYPEMERVAKEAAAAMERKTGAHYTVGNTANALYPAAGGSDDWTKANTGARYVYTIEMRDHSEGRYGFILPPSQIIPAGQEAFEAIKVIAAAASRV